VLEPGSATGATAVVWGAGAAAAAAFEVLAVSVAGLRGTLLELDAEAATAECDDGVVEVVTDGDGGRGAETPAMSDPRPSFCRLGASILPLASIPFAD
jgi:hypothetical protein